MTAKKWHLHEPPEVVLEKAVEILWDVPIVTDRAVGANRPDIVVRDKTTRKTLIIDISCPSDGNIYGKETEKISKYGGLRAELGEMWNCKCDVKPIVIGGLGFITDNFAHYLERIPGVLSRELCLKIMLLGSEKIMRSVLARK